MKQAKWVVAVLLAVVMLTVFVACQSDEIPEQPSENYAITVDNITLTVGATQAISYKIQPVGTAAEVTYAVTEGSSYISIENGIISALAAGGAKVKATATNVVGAEQEFSVETTFTVTVQEVKLDVGSLLVNGGFENQFIGWEVIAEQGASFDNVPVDNTAHTGQFAFNLWHASPSNPNSEVSAPLDLTITQQVNVEEEGKYLLSLWVKGNVDLFTLSILQDNVAVAEETIAYVDAAKYIMADQANYAQIGIDADLAAGKYTVSIKVEAAENNWGYIDDVKLAKGSVEDLVRPEILKEDININFVNDGAISTGWSEVWTSSTTDENGSIKRTGDAEHNCVEVYSKDFTMYQQIDNLPQGVKFDAVWYVRSSGVSDYTAQEYNRFFIKDAATGEVLYSKDYNLPNWVWTRYSMTDLELPSSVIIGVEVKFDGTKTGWVEFASFYLFSDGYEAPSEEHICQHACETCGKCTDAECTDPACADKCTGHNVATHECGHVCEVCGKCTDTECTDPVCADKCAGHQTEEESWVSVAIVNGNFNQVSEDPEGYPTGWTLVNIKDNCTTSSSNNVVSGSGIMAWGNVETPGEEATVSQKISAATAGFAAGDKIRISVYTASRFVDDGVKTPYITGLKLYIGAQVKDCMPDMSTGSSFQKIVFETTLTEEDIDGDGNILVGVGFVMISGGWCNIDDFAVEKIGVPSQEEHICQHACETCGKCTDAECSDPACADKCTGHGEESQPTEAPKGQNLFTNGEFDDGEYKATGWTINNIKEYCVDSKSNRDNGTGRGVTTYDKITDKASPASLTQTISGLAVGDKVTITAWINTGISSDSSTNVESIKLLVGSHAVEVLDNYNMDEDNNWTWQQVTFTVTLTEEDFENGKLVAGIECKIPDGDKNCTVKIDGLCLIAEEE